MTTAALSLVLVSALLHAIWTASIKQSREPLGFNLLQTLPFVPAALGIAAGVDLSVVPSRAWACLLASCGIHAAYVFWMARALERSELSVAYPIMRSTPALLPLLAVPLLGESVSLAGAAGIAIVVVGMWLVNTGGRTSLARLVGAGTGFAYLTLLATVGYSLSDKAAMASLSDAAWASAVPRSLVYFVLLGVGHGACVAPFVLHRIGGAALAAQARAEWRRILFAAVMTTGSYTLILEALRHAPVSYVAAVRQSSVLFA
ncbi:MAG: EamA family transporter, partial [Myxococcales bacterium]|nr:EamA family transporter [Myxococcales bacterium]